MTEISKEYAEALFELASEQGILDDVYGALTDAKKAFSDNPEYTELMSSRGIPVSERVGILLSALEGAPECVGSFAAILCEKGLFSLFGKCVDEFELLYNESKKISKAYVTSSESLTSEQESRLRERLEAMSHKKIQLICSTDRSLIAGIRVVIDDKTLDGSLKVRLQDIKEVIEG